MIKGLQYIPLHVARKVTGYFWLAALFFALSFTTLYFVHHYFSAGRLRIPSSLLSANVIGILAILLVLYFLADGLRLYSVIRAMGFRIAFSYIIKLVFVNIFVSNVTPLATGGGVVQVYFMQRKGMPVGEAMAATSIRTILATRMKTTTASRVLTAPTMASDVPKKTPGRIYTNAQPTADSTLTTAKCAGPMPSIPATTGITGRTGPTKRPNRMLLPPCR